MLVDYPMPNFKEFNLKNFHILVEVDNEVSSYIPDLITPKAKHNKKFVMAVLSSIRSDFMQQLVGHAH